MLKELLVKNLAVIQEESVSFKEGLNILTGETGAGKSVLLGSVNLALGERADRSLIRTGTSYALAELTFDVKEPGLENLLQTYDLFPEDGALTLSRKITNQRSTARINGESVSSGELSEVAGLLLNIHGQSDTQILLKEKNHRELLDAYGGEDLKAQAALTKDAYQAMEQAKKQLANSRTDEASLKRAVDLLEYEIAEIEQADLQPGEDDVLENTYRKLSHSQKIMEECGCAQSFLGERGGAVDQLGHAVHALQRCAEYDSDVSEILDHLCEMEALLQDTSRDLLRYLDSMEYDPQELDRLRERLDLINRLKSKYGSSIEDVLEYLDGRKNELDRLCHADQIRSSLEKEVKLREASYLAEAEILSRLRKEAAQSMQAELICHLSELNFPSVQFEITSVPLEKPAPEGLEKVEFLVSLNPGQPLKSLALAASGGELSRIMLAIRTVLAEKDSVPTVIFDEIDTGISGRTAAMVAKKLRKIAKHRQVICITHLPQIAAAADHHYLIEKELLEDAVHTHIREIEGEESVAELARILGGDTLTQAALENAREMKLLAKQE